jgi:hypothetical protein
MRPFSAFPGENRGSGTRSLGFGLRRKNRLMPGF